LADYRTTFTVQQILSWLIFGATLLIAKTGLNQWLGCLDFTRAGHFFSLPASRLSPPFNWKEI